MRVPWDDEFEAEAEIDNDANDYYYEWISLSSPKGGLKELFEKYLGIGYDGRRLQVKARKGAIFFKVLEELK